MKKILLAFFFLVLAACEKNPTPEPTPVVPNPVPPKVAKVTIGTPGKQGTDYSWSPIESLSDPHAAQPVAFPKKSTRYTVEVKSKCGIASSSVMVRVYKKGPDGELVEVN